MRRHEVRSRVLCAAVIVLGLFPVRLGASPSVTVTAVVTALVDTETPSASPLDPSLFVEFGFFSESDTLTFDGSARVSVVENTAQVTTLRVDWMLSELFLFSSGKFVPMPGQTVFFSSTPLFYPASPALSLIGTSDFHPETPLAWQAQMFFRSGYARLVIAPTPPRFSLPEPGTPWFPDTGIPSTISLWLAPPLPSGFVTWHRNQIAVDLTPPPPTIDTVSAAIEFGANFRGFDVSLIAFRGVDSRMVFTSDLPLRLKDGEPIDYTVTLRPTYHRHSVVALRASGSISRFWWWGEAGYLPDTVLTHRAAASKTLTVGATTTSMTFGAGYFLPRSLGRVVLETTYLGVAADHDEPYSLPFLSSASGAAIELSPFSRVPVSFGMAGVFEYPTIGSAVVASISYAPTPQITISTDIAHFAGEEGSLAANFRNNHPVAIRSVFAF